MKKLIVIAMLIGETAFGQGKYTRYPAYASVDLSNLVTTSLNQSLLPNADNTLTLGSSSLSWGTVYTRAGVDYLTDSGTNGVLVQASAASSNYTLKWPAAIPATGQTLTVGGDLATFSWVTPVTLSALNTRLADSVSAKIMVIGATTAALGTLTGTKTVDGIDTSINPGAYLVKNQADATTNGIWITQSGAWTRDPGMPDGSISAQGALVSVIAGGTTNGNTLWFCNGDGSNVTFSQIPSISGQVPGTTTNDTAVAGYVGEIAKQTRLRSAAASLTTTTTANVTGTALTLTAGDWEIHGAVGFNPGATTSVTRLDWAVSATSATLPAADTMSVYNTAGEISGRFDTAANVLGGDITYVLPPARLSITTGQTKTLYLVSQGTFSVSTLTVYGQIYATRIR